MKERVILHSDLNSFYASVECMENPQLKERAVAVVGDPDLRHGIILAKNERAKSCGVKTGQVIWEAKVLCPDLITIRANFDKYLSVSKKVRSIYDSYTDRVESFGIDECWLDVSGLDGKRTADEIRARVKKELGITVSVGVSWNKIYAKLASDLKKPDATIVINRDNYKQMIYDLPAEYLLNVGKATRARLEKFNIRTIGDISLCDASFLRNKLGKWGSYLWTFATGQDVSAVSRSIDDTKVKSVGNSSTAVRDLVSLEDVLIMVTLLSESVAERLRRKGLKGDVIHLDVVDNLFNHFAKQTKIATLTNASTTITEVAMALFRGAYQFKTPIRSIGVRVSGIVWSNAPTQLCFFDQVDKKVDSLENALDNIRAKFGNLSISRGIELVDKRLSGITIRDYAESPLF